MSKLLSIQTSEQRYKALFQTSSAAIMLLKEEHFYDCNQATLDLFGFTSKEAFCCNHPADLSPPYQPDGRDSNTAARAYITQALEQGCSTFEWIHLRKNQSVFSTKVQLTAIHIGDCVEIQAVVTDLSDIKEGEAKLKQVFDFLPSGVGVNMGGQLVYANSKLAHMLGYSNPNDIINQRMLSYVSPEDRARAIQRKNTIVQNAKPVKETEMLFLKRNGETLEAAVQSEPFYFDGQDAILVVIRDITHIKKEQKQRQLLTQAIMQSSEAIMILNTEGKVEMCNPAAAEVYGEVQDSMVGQAMAELRGGKVGDPLYNEIISTIQRGKTWEGEVRLPRLDDTRLVARRAAPVLDEQGKVQYQIVVDRDITKERQQQEKMEHVQRLESLGVLAGGIAHDFNNLLTAMMGHAALAHTQCDATANTHKHITAIEQACDQAASLCQQMLAYSGKGKFVTEPINLSDLIHDMTRLLEVSIHKNVTMLYELTPTLPCIEGDLSQIQQIVMNLIINANEAIGDRNGNIILATGVMQADSQYLNSIYFQKENLPEGSYVYLEVSDTGCGMSEETKNRLFEPFYTTKFTGRGLGMSAILGIVQGHHGVIKLDTKEGQGSSFKVLFPAVADTQSTALPSAKQHVSNPYTHATILLVDDDESIREVTTMLLESEGYQVIQAVDGMDGVEKLQQYAKQIDCVLLDMTMPRMGGEDAFSEMQRIKPNIHVLLSSGYNEQSATQHFTGKGLSGFIQKPYTPESLFEKLSQILNN